MADYNPDFHSQKTLFQIGVKAVIKNPHTQKILILTRSEKVTATGIADLPGGNLENFESPLEGIQREIKEETGLTCSNFKLLTVQTVHHHDQPLLIIGYSCETDSDQVSLNWECSAYTWTDSKDALQLDLPYSHLEIIQKLLSS